MAASAAYSMDTGALHGGREARRRTVRRRRRGAGLLAAVVVAAATIAVVTHAGGASQVSREPHPPAGVSRHALAQHRSGYAAHAGASRSTGRPGKAPVPILMYHVIAPPPAGAPFPGLYVSAAELAAQVEALKSAGWHAVTLDQVQAYWRSGVPLGPGKPIVLSFDNGYHSQYTQAVPILRRVGWVGDENLQLTGLPLSQGGLSQPQIAEMVAAGWELDTQGISHADLITLDPEQLHYQVAVARSMLERRYHVPVNWFCYPSGHYDATVIDAVKAAGYTGSTTVVAGWAHPEDDRYRLHRLRVLGGTTPQQLIALISSIREDPPAPSSYR